MIGDQWYVDVTVETMDGPDTAVVAVADAIERTGWLWLCRDTTSFSQLLPGEEEAFIRGERPVCSSVEMRVQLMQPAAGGAIDDEIIEAVLTQLRAAGVPCRGISVARDAERRP